MQPIAPNTIAPNQVPIVDDITREEFYRDYVNPGKPVLIRNKASEWKALDWNKEYFKNKEGGVKLAVKVGDITSGKRAHMPLSEYINRLEKYDTQIQNGEIPEKPGYLHDVPFFHLFPNMVSDIEPFPVELFPEWYWDDFHNYIQFFMGATGSLTPLHFDTLYTNNLFFQIVGKKKFILVPASQQDLCYIKGWRWAQFDPSRPDYEKFPKAKEVKAMEVIVGPGDILFMPSGMLHQVHGLSYSISFNIDWHTPGSARKGVMSLFEGAPRKNVFYNFLSYLGVAGKIPSKYLFPLYKSYLNYVS